MKRVNPETEELLAEYRRHLIESGSNTTASAATAVSNTRRLLREVVPLTAENLQQYLRLCPQGTAGTLRSSWGAWTAFCEYKGLPTIEIERTRKMDAPWVGFQVALPYLASLGLSPEQMTTLHYEPMSTEDPFYPRLLAEHPELAEGSKVALWGPRPERKSLRDPVKPRIMFVVPASLIFVLAPYHGNRLPAPEAPLLPVAPGAQRPISPRAIRRILTWVADNKGKGTP